MINYAKTTYGFTGELMGNGVRGREKFIFDFLTKTFSTFWFFSS